MKSLLVFLLTALILSGCANHTVAEISVPETTAAVSEISDTGPQEAATESYVSRFSSVTHITLSDTEISVEGKEAAVFFSHDIIYYEDRDSYSSGNLYGEGEAHQRHSAQEAAAHTVVNITAPGAYRVSGKLSAGQIRVDLGENAYYDPDAVVELILEDADITCTVAPAILFLNTYECDGSWSADTAKPTVDTTAAGANLILEGNNTVSGSHVARIYKDKDGQKKLWKQDGAIYSYMSLNIFGPGDLTLSADNEGLDTELHLTINGGNIRIRSDNDGINTNEDGVSVTTINGGLLHITAGLGAEGDGIDSNGYLVINDGTVISSANPASDAGLDSDLGSYVNGGTVIALGSTMNWAESDSDQVTMNLQFTQQQSGSSAIVVTKEDSTIVFAYSPGEDEILGDNLRQYTGAIISCPAFTLGESYHLYLGGVLTGEESSGMYTSVTDYTGGIQMGYNSNTLGGIGGHGNRKTPPEDRQFPYGLDPASGDPPALPEREAMPADFDPEQMENRNPGNQRPREDGGTPPEGFDSERPAAPDGEIPRIPEGGFGDRDQQGETNTGFPMTDKVNAFSGITAVTE